jgi:hypothetical protein
MCCIDGQENKYSVLNECSRMLKYNILLSLHQYSAPCHQITSVCVPSLMSQTKFRTHTEPQAKLSSSANGLILQCTESRATNTKQRTRQWTSKISRENILWKKQTVSAPAGRVNLPHMAVIPQKYLIHRLEGMTRKCSFFGSHLLSLRDFLA